MASVETIAIALLAVYGVLFAAFLVICFAIRREDKSGSVTGRAPNRTCKSARHVAGWHHSRWA